MASGRNGCRFNYVIGVVRITLVCTIKVKVFKLWFIRIVAQGAFVLFCFGSVVVGNQLIGCCSESADRDGEGRLCCGSSHLFGVCGLMFLGLAYVMCYCLDKVVSILLVYCFTDVCGWIDIMTA